MLSSPMKVGEWVQFVQGQHLQKRLRKQPRLGNAGKTWWTCSSYDMFICPWERLEIGYSPAWDGTPCGIGWSLLSHQLVSDSWPLGGRKDEDQISKSLWHWICPMGLNNPFCPCWKKTQVFCFGGHQVIIQVKKRSFEHRTGVCHPLGATLFQHPGK